MINQYVQIKKKIAKLILLFSIFFLSPLYATVKTIHAEDIFHAVQKTHWFEQGNPHAPHQIYVIAEPNCSACHYFYESVRPYIGRGQLTIRWVFVAFLKKSSFGKALAIIGSKNPAQVLDKNEAYFNNNNETGGVQAVSSAPSHAILEIQKNIHFMRLFGLHSTPIILFKDILGHVGIVKGALPVYEISKFLAQIGRY